VQVIWTRVDLGITYSSLWQSVGLNRDTKLNLCMTTVDVAKLGFRKKNEEPQCNPNSALW